MEDIPNIELPSTPSIRFTGRIFPASIKLSFSTPFVTELSLADGTPDPGWRAKFHFNIKDSEVEVSCHLNRIVQSDLSQIVTSAFALVRSAVDLMAFSLGMGLTVILDKAIYADGSVRDLHHQNLKLPPLCTAFRINQETPDGSLELALFEVFSNRSLMAALHDLTETLEDPHRDRINCARAI